MSLIQKPCPRRPFDCQRCAAKLQNSETVWELTVPTYKFWSYDGQADPPPEPTGEVKIYTDYVRIPFKPDGGLTHCNFSGSNKLLFNPDRSVISTANWPQWVLDFEPAINSEALAMAGTDPPTLAWDHFSRNYNATVQWTPAQIENGSVEVEGNWQIGLSVIQSAIYFRSSVSLEGIGVVLEGYNWISGERSFLIVVTPVQAFLAAVEQLSPLGTILTVYIIDGRPTVAEFDGTIPEGVNLESAPTVDYDGSIDMVYDLAGTYLAPDDFVCPIAEGETYRFLNKANDKFPISVTDITINDLPDGYDWPTGIPKYNADINGSLNVDDPIYYSGLVYPNGLTSGSYKSPPYIDVKHVPRSNQDVE